MKNHFWFPCILVCALCFYSSFVQAQDYCSWETLSPAPNHRVESMTALHDGKLYVFSGFGFEIKILATTTMYDPATDSWTEKAPIPIPLTHTGAITAGDEIWLAGGFEGDNPGTAINAVQVYNTVSDEWRFGPSLPVKRASAGMALVGRKLHVFGGLEEDRQTDVSDHYVLDLDNESQGWQEAAPLPEARNHLSAATVGGKIYAIGGQKGHDSTIENTAFLHMYDPVTDSWTRRADLTFPRSHFEPATFVLDGEIYILGGRTEFQYFNNITKYSPDSNSWTELCALPRRLLAPAARVINNQLYVTHGGAANVRNPLDIVQRRPVERNISADMGFLRSSLALNISQGSQRTIEEAVWVKSNAPQYSLSLQGSPSWVRVSAHSGQASHEGDKVNITVNTSGLEAGTYSTTLRASASGYTTAELPINITVTGGGAVAQAIYLNTGGGATSSVGGISYVNDSNTPSYYNSDHTYANTELSNVLYRTERGSAENAGVLTYNIPLSNGKYTVITHHAELYFGYARANGPGMRVFDIRLEGELVQEDVDLFQEGVGLGLSSEAKIFTFEEVEVSDGMLTLSMDASVNRPTISALEIIPEDVSPLPSDELWLEAEAAEVGSNWQIIEDPEASGGQYVTIRPGMNSHGQAPTGAANHVVFNFNISQAGSYPIEALVKAPNSNSDSFWFRVNNGDWINWTRGVQTYDFSWKAVGDEPFALFAGQNTITFAYREDGTQIDQVHIGSSSTPPATTDFWLESECAATIGAHWEIHEDSEASGGQYMIIRPGMNSHSQAPSSTASHLSFSLDVGQAGTYEVFARVKAPNSNSDSFWLKVNDGDWINWTRGVQTYDFAWKAVETSFALSAGQNTITFAYREDGTQLDKVFVTLNGQVPEGMGESATNCSNNARWISEEKTSNKLTEELDEQQGSSTTFLVYPNPTTDEVRIQLGTHYKTGNTLYLYDARGVLKQQIIVNDYQTLVDTQQLPAGMYYVQYNDGTNSLSRKLMVNK